MPHFIIECSENIVELKSPEEIIQSVYDAAASTELFDKEGSGGIKVRLTPYQYYSSVNTKDDFIHVFGYIMEGRTVEQRQHLSHQVIARLKGLFPDIFILSMNISEFDKSTYCNKSMV